MLLSKVIRGPRSGDYKRLYFREFDEGTDGSGWSDEPAGFIPAAAIPAKGRPDLCPSAPPASASAAPAVNLDVLRQEAFAEGRQAALEESEGRMGRAADALARGLEEISRLRESLLSGSSHDMLRLVMTVARQVVHAEISVHPEVVLRTVERALQAAVQADSHRLLVSPEDIALVKEKKPLFLASIHGLKNITIEADPSIAPGGCRLESELGEVDATVDGQLEEIRRTLSAAIEEG